MTATWCGQRPAWADQTCRQAPDLVVRQEPLATLAAVPADAAAGVGALGPEAHRLGLTHDDGKHRHRAVGGDRSGVQRGEPAADVLPLDVRDPASAEKGKELVAEIAPVHGESASLPDPFVLSEHGLGDRLQIPAHLTAIPATLDGDSGRT